jgi:hypothetical protein
MVKVNPSLISAACGVKEPQTGAADEMAEVGVPGDEGDVVIETRLSDQRVGQRSVASSCQQTGAKKAGARPVAIGDVEERATP